ncbi:MAG: dTDP-glucose 4,6-dehydratase [Elusimicrobia bacterium]|nr:dTDP-glucose 4,6-dehydratase [Elusimicrobiota bacterium]
MKILVTGGAGFIGSHLVRYLIQHSTHNEIFNLDKLTYAGHLSNLKDVSRNSRYHFIRGDICDARLVTRLTKQVDAIIHCAAETHVDRSIHQATPFLRTNVIGTQTLLEAVRRTAVRRFLQISTDEVYGSISVGRATEETPLRPSNPYSASKAAADLLALSYYKTYGVPVIIVRPCNNFGPYQYPEKMLPLFITNALQGRSLPLYGDGQNVRDWLFVEDHCRALLLLLRKRRELGWKPSVPFPHAFARTLRWFQTESTWWRLIKEAEPAFHRFSKIQYPSLQF